MNSREGCELHPEVENVRKQLEDMKWNLIRTNIFALFLSQCLLSWQSLFSVSHLDLGSSFLRLSLQKVHFFILFHIVLATSFDKENFQRLDENFVMLTSFKSESDPRCYIFILKVYFTQKFFLSTTLKATFNTMYYCTVLKMVKL